jgi:hypothetical protein
MLRKLNPITDVEHKIIGTLFDELLEEGYQIRTEFDSGTHYLFVYDDTAPTAKPIGWVKLVRGNGATVISDYTTNLEKMVEPASELADLYE